MEQQQKMDRKSKILITIFFVLLAISVILTYYRTMITRDYLIISSPEEEL